MVKRSGSDLLAWVLIGLAFALRIANLNAESLWRDEVDTIRFACVPVDQLLGNLARAGFNGPLYHLLMRVWLSLSGINDFALRYFSLLCGVALLAVSHALARRLFGRRAALLTLGLMTVAPVLIWYAGEGKMYALQPLLIALALYALRRATGREGEAGARWWLVFIAAMSLGYYVHLLTPLFLAVAAVCVLAWWSEARRHWRGLLIAAALCTLPYLPLVAWQWPRLVSGGDSGHAFYTLDIMAFSLAYNWSVGLSSRMPFDLGVAAAWLGILSFLAAIATAIAGGVASAGRRSTLSMLGWLVLPALMVYAVSTRTPIFEPRYVLGSSPAFYILAAAGLGWLLGRAKPAGLALAAWLIIFCLLGVAAQIIYPIRPDVRGAAQQLAASLQPNDRLVFQIPYTQYGFEYYLPRFIPQADIDAAPMPDDGLATLVGLRGRIYEAPYTNQGAAPDEVAAGIRPVIGPSQRVWLVESEAPLWDRRGLVRAWFDQHAILIERRESRGVLVSLYQFQLGRRAYLPIIRAPSANAADLSNAPP